MINYFLNLNPVILALIATLITWLFTLLGASVVVFFKKVNKNVMDSCLAFSAGVIPKGGVIKEIILTPKIIFTLLVTLVLINLCFSLTKKENKKDIKLNKDENIEIIDLY